MAISATLVLAGGIVRLTTDGAIGLTAQIASMVGGIGVIVGAIGMVFVRSRDNG
jgi:hypothetical protein